MTTDDVDISSMGGRIIATGGMTEEAAKALRAPFPAGQIGKLPRKTKSGGTIHLDYVGHAAVTDRLLAVDPLWNWEPVAFGDDGLPMIDTDQGNAVLWIRLTVCGVTRLGVGICPADAFELDKQLISDALRNAAMRFGVALDLWSRQDLDADDEPARDYSQTSRQQGPLEPPEGRTTSAGNVRRGPEVLEGWADGAEQRAAHDDYAAKGKALPPDLQDKLKVWRAAEGIGYPMTRAQYDRVMAKLAELVPTTTTEPQACPSCGSVITDINTRTDTGCLECPI